MPHLFQQSKSGKVVVVMRKYIIRIIILVTAILITFAEKTK